MLYKAVVIDNSTIFTRGTIRVRIAGLYNRKIIWNLEDRFPETIVEGDVDGDTQFSNDFEANLSGSFAGGRNYGSLTIPQINEKGIVAFLGSSKSNPVWLGGLFEAERDDAFDIKFVNFPTDRFEDGTHTDGVIADGEANLGDEVEPQEEKSIIIRTKHTNSDSAEEVNFRNQDTSNIITVGKRRVRVSHFPEGSWVEDEEAEQPESNEDEEPFLKKIPKKYSDVLIGTDEEGEDVIRIDKKDLIEETYATFEIKDDVARLFIKQKDGDDVKIERSFTIGIDENGDDVIRLLNKNVDDEDYVEFELKKEQSVLSLTKGGTEQARFSMNEDSIILFNKEGENKITFTDSDGVEISNKSGTNKITFNDGDEIEIQNDSGSKIIMKSNGNIELLADNEVHILGNDDHLVRYSELKEIIEEFEDHVHVAPSGPTSPPLTGSQAPIISSTLKLSMDMKSQKGKLD